MSDPTTGPFDYQVFGLRIRSEILLPELFAAAVMGEPDIRIWRSSALSTPKPDDDGHKDVVVLTIPEVGRYRIGCGREIAVEQDLSAPDRNVRLYLLGSAFGVLLLQRGLLPLHANAIEIGGKAVAFMGASGSGKSTLAAWFSRQGYDLIADDVCVVGFSSIGGPYVAPGLPRLRLWAEALGLLGFESAIYERSYVGGDDEYDKFDVPISRSDVTGRDLHLGAIFLLDRGADFSVTKMGGVEAADAVFANTYRGSYLSMINGQENHWRSATRLVRETPIYRATRQWGLEQFDEQCRLLLREAVRVVRSDSHGSR